MGSSYRFAEQNVLKAGKESLAYVIFCRGRDGNHDVSLGNALPGSCFLGCRDGDREVP